MCDCRANIEAKLTERFVEREPSAEGHQVSLQGYGFVVVGNVMQMIGYMPAESSALFILKNGGQKIKLKKQNISFSFCPFCGEKYFKETK